jgi:hypothetical protein
MTLEKTPTEGTRTIEYSEQKRMMLTHNFSQEEKQPESPVGIDFKRPSTVANGLKREQKADSSVISQSKNDSIKFDKDEKESLMEVSLPPTNI